jgi:F420-0:gamma-glutamyl ligase
VEFFLGLEEAGVVAVSDTQVIRRLNVVVTDVVSQEQKKGHTTVSFGSVGLH